MSDLDEHKQIDWRACCIVMANSHLNFVDYIMKTLPDNQQMQELGEELKKNLIYVITEGSIQKARDK